MHRPSAEKLWQMPLAGLITGLVATVVPQVMGNGRAAAQLGFSTFIPETAGTAGAMQSASSAAASPWNLLTGAVMYPIRPLAGERALEWHRSGPCFRVGAALLDP